MDEKKYKQPPQELIRVPRFEEAAGFFTTSERSINMSKIKGKDSKPEVRFRKALWGSGFRFRLHSKKIPGRPDISSQKHKLAIFIDGEFWHGHDWHEKKEKIKSNRAFWVAKIERNMQRDRAVNEELKALGYTVFRFWSKEVQKDLGRCLKVVLDYLSTMI